MRLDDFIMLGTTVPEPSSDSRVFVCSAGFSTELRRLIRIYPLARSQAPTRWAPYRVVLERNSKDTRDESWQIAEGRSRDSHETINSQFVKVGDKLSKRHRINSLLPLLKPYIVGSIDEANRRRLSLAVIQPTTMDLGFEENPPLDLSPQEGLFELPSHSKINAGARRFRWMPRIRFVDDCGKHNLMLRDWGTFELQRKFGPDYFLRNLSSALRLGGDSSLLVGNLNNQRNAWIVISVLNGLRMPASLFDLEYDIDLHVEPKARRDIYRRDDWLCVVCRRSQGLILRRKNLNKISETGVNPKVDDLETFCKDCFDANVEGE